MDRVGKRELLVAHASEKWWLVRIRSGVESSIRDSAIGRVWDRCFNILIKDFFFSRRIYGDCFN